MRHSRNILSPPNNKFLFEKTTAYSILSFLYGFIIGYNRNFGIFYTIAQSEKSISNKEANTCNGMPAPSVEKVRVPPDIITLSEFVLLQ